MTKSQVLLYLCLIYIAGVFVYSLIESPQPSLFEETDQEITLRGVIVAEPEQRVGQQRFRFRIDGTDSSSRRSVGTQSDGGINQIAKGLTLITAELYPEYQYGDELEVSGEIQEPAIFEDFDYRQYLRKDGIYSVMYYPQISLLAKGQGNWFYGQIFELKSKLRGIIDQFLLPPSSSLLRAIFLGEQNILSDELKEKLNITGTRHVAAVSGSHMVIMTQILMAVALGVGLWRQQAFYLVIFSLAAYIIMVGAPASAVRSGVMSFLILFAQQIGRLNQSGRSIVFAAAGMLAVNPLLIKSDVGFQLSFVAVLGLIYLKPVIDRFWPRKYLGWTGVKDILSMTLAAQIAVLPLLIFHFGQISLVSILANLAIVPLMPLVMASGFVLSLSGLIWSGWAQIVSWPIWLLLTLTVKLIDFFASWPLAQLEFRSFPTPFLIGYYLILVGLIWFFRRKIRSRPEYAF